jgi:Cys-rich repeat protein
MRIIATRIFPLLCVFLALTAFGCSGEQTPGDNGVGVDADADNGDKTTLCQTNEECGAGMECRGGVCVSTTSCSCNYDCDKSNNEICNPATHQCETGQPPLNCRDDCDCYTGESCISGTCRPSGGDQQTCTIDEDCPQGQVCTSNKCVNESCTTRDDCAPPACVCKESECTAPPPVCQGDADCCTTYRCNFGTCVPENVGCQSDDECKAIDPEFPRCVDGQCVQECNNDIDCPLPGQVCVNHHCISPDCTVASCDQGQWCDVNDGQCKPGCDENSDCVSPQTCNYTTHQCGQTDCCGGACNPQTQYCDGLTCQCVDTCQTDADCPAGFECKTDGRCWCTAAGCPAGTTCSPQTGECVQDTVQCTTDADCPAGWTCNLATNQCESQGTAGEGDTCFGDAQCDAAAGLLCDSSLFCIGCSIADPNFNPTFTCRFECSLFLPNCPAQRECLYRHLGLTGLCMPP